MIERFAVSIKYLSFRFQMGFHLTPTQGLFPIPLKSDEQTLKHLIFPSPNFFLAMHDTASPSLPKTAKTPSGFHMSLLNNDIGCPHGYNKKTIFYPRRFSPAPKMCFPFFETFQSTSILCALVPSVRLCIPDTPHRRIASKVT